MRLLNSSLPVCTPTATTRNPMSYIRSSLSLESEAGVAVLPHQASKSRSGIFSRERTANSSSAFLERRKKSSSEKKKDRKNGKRSFMYRSSFTTSGRLRKRTDFCPAKICLYVAL